ncbi:MAG: helix-turn-helix domain-containing protein [Mycobacterium sp.]
MSTFPYASDARGKPVAQIRRRPKDRKAQITRAAAQIFGSQGYHAASMEAIAARVGISAPALYRHFPSKYELFVAVVFGLGQHLVDATDFIDNVTDAELAADPAAILARLIDKLTDAALANREVGGLYRWQGRHLQPADHTELMDRMGVINRRVQRPLVMIRPTLTAPQRWTLSAGLFSVVGSIIGHRPELPEEEVRAVLADAASALLATELPTQGDPGTRSPSVWRIFTPDGGPYEALLHGAITLFGQQGYAATSVTQIAEAVGVPASGVYRYFSSKCDLLTTGLRRAVDRVAGELSAIGGVFTDPHQVLTRRVEAYVATAFANPQLWVVYNTERVNLAPDDLEQLRDIVRTAVESWVEPLTSLRPELPAARARFLVYAATALVIDVSRMARDGLLGGGGSDYGQLWMRQLMESVLFGVADSQAMV